MEMQGPDTDHGSQHQIVNHNGDGSPTQEHVPHIRDMDGQMPPMNGMPGESPFVFNVGQPQSPFDRNGAINAYKQMGIGGPIGFNNNFHHELALQQRKPLDGSEDDEYGQNTPGKRKLDDVMQRQQHSNREKRRRNEMNESIESIKLLLPQSDKNRFRVTKVSILNEAIEYIQRVKDLCLILAKDKRELHEDNARLYQQLASMGKDVGEPRRWDDRNLVETLQSSVNIPMSPQGLGDFPHGMRFDNQQGMGFPFGMGGPMPHGMPPMPIPFGHPGMPPMMGHPQMRMPRGGPIPPHMVGMTMLAENENVQIEEDQDQDLPHEAS